MFSLALILLPSVGLAERTYPRLAVYSIGAISPNNQARVDSLASQVRRGRLPDPA